MVSNQESKEIRVGLNSKQLDAYKTLTDHSNSITEVLYGGAAGGGKSFLGCFWLITQCLTYPESRWLMGRSRLKTLKETTLKTFFEVATKLKISNQFTVNNQSNTIIFNNGSEILLKDLFHNPSDPNFDSLGSLEISGAFIDEVNQLSKKAKDIVVSRIRFKLDELGIIPKCLMSCNPTKNWVFSEYYQKHNINKLENYKKFIPALSNDNKKLSKHYINNLNKLEETDKQRLLYGVWEYSDETSIFFYDSLSNLFQGKITGSCVPNHNFMTIDVARLGKDKTNIYIWKDLDVIESVQIIKTTHDKQLETIRSLQDKWKINGNHIAIDSDGVGGSLSDFIPDCIKIVNGSKALNNENYLNLKNQLYFKLADYINSDKIRIFNQNPEHEQLLQQELQVVKRTKIDQDGRLTITSKDEVKRLIGRSPDYSDALAFRMIFEIKPKGEFSFDTFSF